MKKNRLKLGYIKSSYYPDGSRNIVEWRSNQTSHRFNQWAEKVKFYNLNNKEDEQTTDYRDVRTTAERG